MKKYRIAFVGNKLNRLDEIADIIKEGGYTEIYEPFGGSCCISINMMSNGIVKKATANDYDEFITRLPFYISTNKRVLEKLKAAGLKRKDKKLNEEELELLHSIIKPLNSEEKRAVSTYYCFHNCGDETDEIKKFKYFYREFPTKKYEEYLEKSKLVNYDKLDCFEFLDKYKNEFNSKTILVVDPPYLNSQQKQDGCNFFGLSQTICLLKKLKSLKIDFIFFNQIARDVEALLELLELNYDIKNKISNIKNIEREDCMAIVKF